MPEGGYRRQYYDALRGYIGGGGEDALSGAYELGRRALAEGLGILDVAALHQEAVSALLQEGTGDAPADVLRKAGDFLIESLSAFELRYRSVDEANAALRRLNELLEKEAKRIAHALHDQAGAILASAGIELDLAVRDLEEEDRARLAFIRRLIDETGEQLRHLSHELRPTILDDLGLRAALDFLAEGVRGRAGIAIELRGRLRERPPAAVETAVYRIVQEALNNVLLHAGEAATVKISMEAKQSTLHCAVSDDGGGFDLKAVLQGAGRHGLGLLGMRERAHAVGGTLLIESTPGHGTLIEVVVPMNSRK